MAKVIKLTGDKVLPENRPPEFDYVNGIVTVRDAIMLDEDKAHEEAKLIFQKDKKEPTAMQTQACLMVRLCKFYNTAADFEAGVEKKFKAIDIIKMPSSFIVDCLLSSGLAEEKIAGEQSSPLENIGMDS